MNVGDISSRNQCVPHSEGGIFLITRAEGFVPRGSTLRPVTFRALVAMLVAFVLAIASCTGERPVLTTDPLPGAVSVDSGLPTAADRSGEGAADASGDVTSSPIESAPVEASPDDGVEILEIEILETVPHDPTAFTQGLELSNGLLVESTGQVGESDLRTVDPSTGEVVQLVPSPPEIFAEGVTRVDDVLIQLTWKDERAFYWDAATLTFQKEERYGGQGWGMCYTGTDLLMTDGSAGLITRDVETMAELARIQVSLEGVPVDGLNELECVGDEVWANVWQENYLVRIDPATGEVTGFVDADELVSAQPQSADVLNGIAWDESNDTFFLTGKYWPNMYRVRLVPAEPGPG